MPIPMVIPMGRPGMNTCRFVLSRAPMTTMTSSPVKTHSTVTPAHSVTSGPSCNKGPVIKVREGLWLSILDFELL